MTEDEEDETQEELEETEGEEEEMKEAGSKKWLWITLGVIVVVIAAWLLLHHPVAAPVDKLPQMVGGC